jgi:hypothetical protein
MGFRAYRKESVMGRLARSERVKCPKCGQQEFDAIPGSECFCGCGTAFRICIETGRPVEIEVVHDIVSWSRGRKRDFGLHSE